MSANEQGRNPWATTIEQAQAEEIVRLTKRVAALEKQILQLVEMLHGGGK